jgi:hypothetical protein
MSSLSMVLLAVVVIALPVALMVAFHGPDRADGRGRPLPRRWRAEQQP